MTQIETRKAAVVSPIGITRSVTNILRRVGVITRSRFADRFGRTERDDSVQTQTVKDVPVIPARVRRAAAVPVALLALGLCGDAASATPVSWSPDLTKPATVLSPPTKDSFDVQAASTLNGDGAVWGQATPYLSSELRTSRSRTTLGIGSSVEALAAGKQGVWYSAPQLRSISATEEEPQVYGTTRPGGGVFRTPARLSDPTLPSVAGTVASNKRGDLVAAWLSFTTDNHCQINVAVGTPAGGFGSRRVVAQEDFSRSAKVSSPTPVISDDGTIAVSWGYSAPSGKYSIVKNVSGTVAGVWDGTQKVSEPALYGSLGRPHPAIATSGRVSVAWSNITESSDGLTVDAVTATRLSGRSSFEDEQELANPTGRLQLVDDIDVDNHGYVVVALSSVDPSSFTSKVQVSSSAIGSATFSTPSTISGTTVSSDSPDIAARKSGGLVVVYVAGDPGAGVSDIEMTEQTSTGYTTPSAVTSIGEDLYSPRAGVNEHGDLSVAWTNFGGSQATVQATHRPAGGTFGTADTVSDPGRAGIFPAVLTGPHGSGTVVWTGFNEWTDWIASRSFR